MLTVSQLSKAFAGRALFDDVSLQVNRSPRQFLLLRWDSRLRVTAEYWTIISTIKHRIMAGCEAEVKVTLAAPDEIPRSKRDANVYLFYRKRESRRWVCAVTKQENDTSVLITAYLTDAIKEGDKIWPS
jgi:hypothetical protein